MKFWMLIRCCSAMLLAGICWGQSVDVPGEPMPAAALVSPEFAGAFNPVAVVAAVRADDTATLVSLARELSQAESKLGKPNAALPAAALFQAAIRAAANVGDREQLIAATDALRAAPGLSPEAREELLREAQLSLRLIAVPRRIDPQTGLKPGEASPESIALHRMLVRELALARDYGTETELETLIQSIKQMPQLHPKQTQHLLQTVDTTRVAIRERIGTDSPLRQVVAMARSAENGVRILGPDTVGETATVPLLILPTGTTPTTKSELFLRGSIGVTVERRIAWDGKPVVVMAKIQSRPLSYVWVNVGTTPSAIKASWCVRISRPE